MLEWRTFADGGVDEVAAFGMIARINIGLDGDE
jgi:hypothetical protein